MLTRRELLKSAAGMGAAALLGGRALGGEPRLLRIGQVLPAGGAEAAARGALLGAEEGGRTAELLGSRLELVVRTAEEARVLVEKDGVLALVGGLDAPSREVLGEVAESLGVPFLTTRTEEDSVDPANPADTEPLRRHVFHIASTRRERREALARWRAGRKEPLPEDVRVVDWHPGLSRFGAEQLNQRFQERFGAPMDSLAWASWAAVKVIAEVALRNPSLQRSELSHRLESFRFDGHKGVRLSFRREDHRLVQPLYVVSGAEVLGEVAPEEA